MSLAPQEQERLIAIENQLHATDPRFATMFRLLTDLDRRGHGHRRVLWSVWLARRGVIAAIILLATTATLIGTCAAAVAVLA